MGIKVIGFDPSPTTFRVALTLAELGVEYEFEPVTDIKTIKSPEFLATKNPLGKVPVMIDDGFTLYESRTICRYLANKYQGTKNSTILIPTDLQKAALIEQFISVESLYYDQPSSAITYEEVIVVHFKVKESDAERVKVEKEKLGKVLDVYEKILEGKDYLTGEFSLADLVHIPNVYININKTSAKDIYYDPSRPNLTRWIKNIIERPTWKQIVTKHKLDQA